jgi:SSS family solute:Na+ symporter
MNALIQSALAVGVPWHNLDTIVLAAFFVGMIVVVIWSMRKKEESSQDYFLAGKKATWLEIGTSIFSSNIGSEHLVGLAGAGFVSGMAMAHWEMHAWFILILGWVFVPFYDRIKIFTMPEFLEHRFSSGSRTILSMISLVSYVLTKVAVTVYSGGVVFGTVFGIESVQMFGYTIPMFWVSAIGLVVITGIYTIAGGMKAIMYTSVLQTPVLLIGSVLILFLGLKAVGGWGELQKVCGANMQLVRPTSDPEFPWTGVLFGSMIIGFWYWCTDQYIVQRVLSGKNQSHARRGAILAGYFKLLPVFIFLVPGMIAFALSQKGLLDLPLNTKTNLPDSDKAFSCLVAQLLPIGFKGVVVCGLLAALMSSLASLFNSSAALFVGDFYKKFKPAASERHLVIVGRIATAAVVVLGILWIPVMRGLGDVLYKYLQAVQGLLAPAIAAAFAVGVFWKRGNATGSLWGLIVGFGLGMFRLVLNVIYGDMTELVINIEKARLSVGRLTEAAQANFVTGINNMITKLSDLVPSDAAAATKESLSQTVQSLSTVSDASKEQSAVLLGQAKMSLEQLFQQQHGILYQITAINWLHYCEFLFLICIAVMVVVSLLTKAPSAEQLRYTYYNSTAAEKAETKASWNAWDIVHTVIILGIIVAFYAYFWSRGV